MYFADALSRSSLIAVSKAAMLRSTGDARPPAPPEVESQLEELAKELDSEALRTQIIVALDSSSRIRDGEEAELHVDSSRMHLFEPGSGDNLTLRTVSDDERSAVA